MSTAEIHGRMHNEVAGRVLRWRNAKRAQEARRLRRRFVFRLAAAALAILGGVAFLAWIAV